MRAEPYDFRNAARLGAELDRRLAGWLRAAAGLSAKRWGTLLSFAAEMHAEAHQVAAPGAALAALPEDAVCLRIAWHWQPVAGAASDLTTLAVVARPLTLALLAGLTGEKVEGPVEDRALTALEESLCGYLVEALLIGLLRESWPGGQPLRLDVGAREAEYHNSRVFPPGEPVLVFSFRVTGPFGEGQWWWVVPRGDWFNQLLTQPQAARPATGHPDPWAQLAGLAERFPVRLSVRLGNAEVSLHQLSRLRAGDLVVLDQRVHEPLKASVDGAEKFRVWPGAVGERQAVEIHSLSTGVES